MTNAKAWVAAAALFLGELGVALQDGVLTGSEIGVIIGTVAAGAGLVWRVPNKTTE